MGKTPPLATLIGAAAGLAFGTAGVVGVVGVVDDDRPAAPTTITGFPSGSAQPPPAPSVPAAPEPPQPVSAPTRIEVPAIGVDERLTGRGLRPDGSLDTPDFGDASWYEPGPRPGEPGGAVVVAHVHGPDGPDVFWDLATLRPGDLIRVHRAEAVATFVVDGVENVPKDALPYDEIWPDTSEELLRLITCGGKRDPELGYPDNTIVYAHLASTSPSP